MICARKDKVFPAATPPSSSILEVVPVMAVEMICAGASGMMVNSWL